MEDILGGGRGAKLLRAAPLIRHVYRIFCLPSVLPSLSRAARHLGTVAGRDPPEQGQALHPRRRQHLEGECASALDGPDGPTQEDLMQVRRRLDRGAGLARRSAEVVGAEVGARGQAGRGHLSLGPLRCGGRRLEREERRGRSCEGLKPLLAGSFQGVELLCQREACD